MTDGGTFILLFSNCKDKEELSLPKLYISVNKSSRIRSPLSVTPPLSNRLWLPGNKGNYHAGIE